MTNSASGNQSRDQLKWWKCGQLDARQPSVSISWNSSKSSHKLHLFHINTCTENLNPSFVLLTRPGGGVTNLITADCCVHCSPLGLRRGKISWRPRWDRSYPPFIIMTRVSLPSRPSINHCCPLSLSPIWKVSIKLLGRERERRRIFKNGKILKIKVLILTVVFLFSTF